VDRSFPNNKDKIRILDVAAGTGLVGDEVGLEVVQKSRLSKSHALVKVSPVHQWLVNKMLCVSLMAKCVQ
jgi:hypothetical protein